MSIDKASVLAWIDAAVADGWTREATYQTEGIERASKLTRDWYQVSVLTREPKETKWGVDRAQYSMSAWCPRGLALEIPHPYSFEALKANENLCSECKQMKPKTSRVAFANRVCDDCKPSAKAKYEKHGWDD